MNAYEQIIQRLFETSSALGTKRGLDTAIALDQFLSHPTSSYPVIHVAGSNGKGSVATKIAKALERSGYSVGLYTSPHLFSFRERIVINSVQISEEEVVEILNSLFTFQTISPTFFELTTFLAFEYFRKCKVDVAVIETGLGGRLDATNIVHPILSVITSICCEHTAILGKEIEHVAAEKAGIIKENVPVILGPKARFQVMYDKAAEKKSPVFVSKMISHFFDEENSAVARLALKHLDPHFTLMPEAIEEALLVRPSCRFERVGDVIFDVAHNPEAIFSLLQALHAFFPERQYRFLLGFSKDKEYDQCLEWIANVATHIHLVQADTSRAATTQELSGALKTESPQRFTSHLSVTHGVLAAYSQALSKEELLIVCGTFYIMQEAKEALGIQGQLNDFKETIFPPSFSSAFNSEMPKNN